MQTENIIDDLITINAAFQTLEEAIQYIPDRLRPIYNNKLDLIITTFSDLTDKNVDMKNKDELYLYSIALKQIRLMIIELFDQCEQFLNNGENNGVGVRCQN